jgi:protein-tyrosine phosphatase
MIQPDVYERKLTLSGCGNFRDLGGYEAADGRTVRWRVLFRSDALTWLTAEDIETLTSQGLQLAAGFDLRTPQELALMAPGIVFESGARHHHMPFIPQLGDDPQRMRQVALATGEIAAAEYMTMASLSHTCFYGLYNALASEDSYPAAFYCAAGKDRTGMVSAVLLRTLGVPDEQIVEDYALTGPPDLERMRRRLEVMGREFDPAFDPAKLAARPDTMQHFLRAFDEQYGSAQAFLAECGVTERVIEQVREHLLEA